MLEIRNITKVYKSNKTKKEVTALDNISISFPTKGLITFMGESGCGKSTLMNILAGLDTCTEGEVLYNGKGFKRFKKKDFDYYRRNEIGLVFQEDNLLYDLTVYDNVVLPLKFMGLPIQQEKIDSILEKMSILDLKDRGINELSGGQKQRVAIARTLVKNPKVILADEPTGSLDEKNARIIFEILQDISKEILVIVFTHDKTLATTYSNSLYRMNSGKIEEIIDINPIPKEDSIQQVNKHKGFPFLYMFKMGFSNLKIKIRRLVLIIVLSSFAFSLFGVCLSTLRYTEPGLFAKCAEKHSYSETLNISRWERKNYSTTIRTELDREFIDSFNKNMSVKITPIYYIENDIEKMNHNFLDESRYNELKKFQYNKNYSIYLLQVNSFAVLTEEDIISYSYPLVGHIPANEFEIAISDYQYYTYFKLGYKKNELEIVSKDITKESMIGKVIDIQGFEFTITGIFDTGFNVEEYESLFTKENLHLEEKFKERNVGFSTTQIVTENTLKLIQQEKQTEPYMGKVVLPKSKQRVEDIYHYIKECCIEDVVDYRIEYFKDDVESATAVLTTVKYVTGIVAIVFAIFSVLLLYSYVNMSITNRMYDIGILRSLGANATDTAIIFSSEVFIISMLNFVISLILTASIVAIINDKIVKLQKLSVAPYDFDFLVSMALLGVCVLAGAVSLILPVFRLTRKKVISLIK